MVWWAKTKSVPFIENITHREKSTIPCFSNNSP